MSTTTAPNKETIDAMFAAGAHFGVAKARRHPTSGRQIFAQKQHVDVFDLEKTSVMLEKAKAYVRELGAERKSLLMVGGKPESMRVVKQVALRVGAPYCVGRWIGGTLTNHSEIVKRTTRLATLLKDRESGALSKYTKLERLLIDREIDKLETMYAGIMELGDKLPNALFVVDPRREQNAIREAKAMHIPVVALANSDCNLAEIDYPISGNDSAPKSIAFFVEEIGKAYEEGLQMKPNVEEQQATDEVRGAK